MTPEDVSRIAAAVSTGVAATGTPVRTFVQRCRDFGVIACTDAEADHIAELAGPLIEKLLATVCYRDSQISYLNCEGRY